MSNKNGSRLRGRESWVLALSKLEGTRSSNLVEVLEALIGECDGDTEDGVGGVLVEACFTVSTKESQSPAPER